VRPYNDRSVLTQSATIAPSGEPFLVGEWLVDPSLGRLSRGTQTVRLELKAMAVLLCLVDRAGEVVSKRDLFDAVWRTEFVSDNTLQGRIAELRGAFGDDAGSPRYIETVRTRGYRLIAPIRAAGTIGDCGAPARFWLISEGSSIPLQPGEAVLGRATDADIVIRSPKVSRSHARIVVGTDRCVLEDLGSTNGTWVNGDLVTSPRELAHGDRIRIGRGERIYQFASSDPDAETVPSVASSSVDSG
jgi:DNA-binding winged helix-turn-helix (wHTH) protein